MIKNILCIAYLLGFSAISITAAARSNSSYQRGNQGTELIEKFYADVDNSSFPARELTKYFTSNFKDNDRSPNTPAEVSDKDGIIRLFIELESGFPGSTHKLEILQKLDRNRAMVYWTFEGVHSGSFFGIPATNNQVSINGVDIFRIKNGKFLEQWHVEELQSLFEQLKP